ncbi:MAG: carboxypeptidase regulatory-like domain-containing protein [Candidatus Cloacimonadaceae bacterium]|jgi:hypothetical protein|nr:carboxypeptidase regulatory-like domain-containing protein [Candidatus Cloacimonadaceae bacterium]
MSATDYASSLRYQSDSNNGLTGTTGTTSMNRSNIRFFMTVDGMGSINGTVTVGGSPLEGAEIAVENTLFTAVSGADGTYNLPFVPEGAQTVTASKHGYADVTHTVTVVEDQATTQNFALSLLPQVTVSGRVVGSDAPTVGLEGATITLSGYEPYEATTNASGHFTIPNVFANQTYSYMVTALGYAQLPGQQVVGTTSVDMGDLIVSEVAYPVSGVVATESDDASIVTITWNEPAAGEEAWLHYDSGDSTTSIGTGAAADFDVAIRFPGTALLDHVGTSLQAVKVWPAQAGDFFIRVWTGGTPDAPANMVVDQPFTAVVDQWNTVVLDNPVPVTGSEELWFGYRCVVTTGHPAGCSPGPIVDGFSNMMFYQDEWATLIELNPDLDYNWSIRGYVGFGAPTRGKKLIPLVPPARGITEGTLAASGIKSTYSQTADTDGERALIGYKVYRLLDADQDNEDSWITLTANTISPTEYVDNAWGTLPFGVYRYAVKAVYTNDVLSSPAFSNIVRIQPNDMSALTISGSLTPSVGTPSEYTIRVKNTGTSDQTAGAYTVKLMSDDTELVSVSGPAIGVDEELDVILSWSPTEQGTIEVYGKVVLPEDLVPSNDETDPLTVSVMAEGLLVVGIGDGTATNSNTGAPAPYGTWYRAFRQQLLYRADDFYTAGGIPGMISALAFNVQGLDECTPMTNYTIRLKATDQEALSSTFETGEYTTVWQRPSFMPELAWNIHTFDVPFFWDGTSNIIVDIVTDVLAGNYSRNALVYYTTTNYTSSLRYQSDSSNGSSGTTGNTSNDRSNIRFFMIPAGGDPIFIVNPSSHDFGDTSLGGSRSRDFTIINAGGGSLNINAIEIAGSGTMALSNLPTLPASLETAETAVFTVNFTPVMLGEESAIVTITDDQDTRHIALGRANPNARASHRDTHTVAISGTGVNDITIGDGSLLDRIPMDFYYNNSVFQTIYSIDEMSNFVGMITGLKFYNNFSSSLTAMPTKIWLGSTTQTDLTDGWISSNDLTSVFDGVVDFPSGQNTISIEFPEPYLHLDGGNLVMLVNRPMDTDWHNYNDNFLCQNAGTNRSRNDYSDSTEFLPESMTGGTLSATFPKTTFVVIPGGVGHITGTVIDSDGEPIPGVEVEVTNRRYATTTNANGEFHIANVLPNDYAITFSRYTYISQTVNITLEEDETEVIDITMQLMPQVNVSGTILASDTGLGIAGANIHLNGYADYSLSSSADGSFAIAEVFADQSYEYVISAAGYTSSSGIIDVGSTDYNMGNITLTEIAYAPNSVQAEFNDSYDAINLSWNAPDPNAIEIIEGFESTTFPPADWTQVITNQGNANPMGVFPTWCSSGTIDLGGASNIIPSEGLKQAGLWWDYAHQDEWLLTPSFNCPPDAHISFETYLHFGSPNSDHYYVKVSTDGGASWTVLWDGAAQPEGLHNYEYPITIGLEQYGGLQMQLAFHAEDPPADDGLWFEWFIDNIYIGNFADRISFEPASPVLHRSIGSLNAADSRIGRPTPSSSGRANLPAKMQQSPSLTSSLGTPLPKNITRSANRALQGYQVWRLISGQEANESSWSLLTDETISNINHSDEDWNSLPNATYKWAVKAIYTAGVTSVPAFSNPMVKEVISGNIVGIVRKLNGQGIAGATVSAGEGQSSTTNSAGAYSLSLPAGVYTVSASAEGYKDLIMENITVAPNQNTTLNFTLEPTSNENEVQPVTVTALNANYPNPFNPTTTISYDLKEAGWVRLDIYNLKGQKVRTLVNRDQPSGRYRIVFDALDQRGNPLASGIYLYRMQSADYISTRKMLLME